MSVVSWVEAHNHSMTVFIPAAAFLMMLLDHCISLTTAAGENPPLPLRRSKWRSRKTGLQTSCSPSHSRQLLYSD